MDNFQLIENNVENDDYTEISEFDLLSIFINIFPSTIYLIIISLILIFPGIGKNNEYLAQTRHIILYLKLILIIFLLYFIKGFFFYFIMIKKKITNLLSKIFVDIFYLILDISYFIFTIAGSYSFKKLSLDYIINNIYKSIFIFSLIFIGFTHLFLFFVNLISISFLVVNSFFDFLRNEEEFIANHNAAYILSNFIKSQKADMNHIDVCSICLEDIQLGDEIVILKCSNKHYFHTNCIKIWFKRSFCCPLCKSSNLL